MTYIGKIDYSRKLTLLIELKNDLDCLKYMK